MKDLAKDFGGIPDFNIATWSGTDNTAAFAAAMAVGGRLTVSGNFYVPGGVVMNKPTILQGDTFGTSGIFGGPGATSDVVTMRPTAAASVFYDGWGITDLWINAHSTGRHAVRVDLTNPGVYFPVPFWERLFLNGGLGNAFRVDNPNAASFFCAKLEKLLITSGGVYLENCGDSLAMRDVVINSSAQVSGGPSYGIAASFVGGAVKASIEDCNIVANGGMCLLGGINFPAGQILLLNAERAKISALNSESAVGNFSMITLCGGSHNNIEDSSFNNHALTVPPILIEGGAALTVLDNNDVESGVGHVSIGPNSPGTALLGTNRWYNSSGAQVAPSISNQSPPLWVPQATQ